jgi:hypothetical protein
MYSDNDKKKIIRIYQSSKLIYTGEYNSEQMRHGYGVEYYNNKRRYSGNFKNDLYHGDGVLYDTYGNIIHNGTFKNGLIHNT